jgi:hypothetical protein
MGWWRIREQSVALSFHSYKRLARRVSQLALSSVGSLEVEVVVTLPVEELEESRWIGITSRSRQNCILLEDEKRGSRRRGRREWSLERNDDARRGKTRAWRRRRRWNRRRRR